MINHFNMQIIFIVCTNSIVCMQHNHAHSVKIVIKPDTATSHLEYTQKESMRDFIS